MVFTIPFDKLPLDVDERYQRLQEYFCDQRAKSCIENDNWLVEPYWPDSYQYYADPNLQKGINWWEEGFEISKVHQAFKNLQGFNLFLNDSWTLYSWSKWFSQKLDSGTYPTRITILHVDYHNDLMSPRIGRTDSGLRDLLTSMNFDVADPNTVKMSILSGAIGVGSFIVPFIHRFDCVTIRHLCEGPLLKKSLSKACLQKDWYPDDLIDFQSLRPCVKVVPIDIQNKDCSVHYSLTDKMHEWVKDLPQGPVLLHIDMDFFNCRYDGDTDWQKHPPRHDPSLPIILESISSLFSFIAETGISEAIEDIAIGLSPGFFPCEYWESSVSKISELIQLYRKK